MKKKFVIGDRTKDEYISVLDRANKKLEFTNHLASAKEFFGFRERARALQDVFRAAGYNTFDLDTESELARSGFQRFEQLDQYKKEHAHQD